MDKEVFKNDTNIHTGERKRAHCPTVGNLHTKLIHCRKKSPTNVRLIFE